MIKWLIIVAVLVAGPFVGRRLARYPRVVDALIFAIGFLVLFTPIAFSAEYVERYRGTDRGFTVQLLDVCSYLLLFATRPASAPQPFRIVRGAYVAACVASIVAAPVALYALFSLWTLARVYLMVAALWRAFDDPRRVPRLYSGLGWGVIYLVFVCLKQRYVQHLFQVTGTFSHQNTMAMAAYLVAGLAFPVVLDRKGGWLARLAVGAAGLVVVFSLSRGALVMLPIVLGVVYVGSVVRQPTRWKLWIGVAAAVVAAAVVAKSFDTIRERFSSAPERSAESRVVYEKMAERMLQDHPFGIGLNQFSYMAGQGGYHTVANELGASWVEPNALVHNIYWMTVTELGYLGLLVYLATLGHALVLALLGAWRGRGDLRSDLLLGCFAGLLAFAIHGRLEWAARQDRLQYLFWMICVVVAALYRQIATRPAVAHA